jgi:ribosomal protein S18 acetylase RimI-like enzyme
MLSNLFNKAKWAIKTHGPAKAIYWLFFGYFKVNRFLVYRMSLEGCVSGYQKDDELAVRFYLSGELGQLYQNPEFNTYETFIATHLKTSGCLVGYINEKPTHIMWIFSQGDDSRLFDLGQYEAELNYCYTPPSCRGKGIYSRMIRKAAALLREQGISCLFIATHETNDAAIKSISRSGMKFVGTVVNYGVFYRPKWVL